MKIINKSIEEIREYENNPRNNDDAVGAVAESIQIYGFRVPLVIDRNGVIVTGHTRYKAAQKLGLTEVPCIVADDLTDEQIRAFRLADNMVAEKAEWDMTLLLGELQEINLDSGLTGFEDYEIENILNPFDESDADDFFEDAEQKEKEPKMVQCPCCGEWFEE
jgi:site-specific DNA-methyltransferase (adenine-specific)